MAEQAPAKGVSGGASPPFGADHRWEDVVRQYRTPLRRFFASRTDNPSDVDDLVQKVFVRMIQRTESEPIERVQQYLFQVAASVLYDERKRAKLRFERDHVSYDEAEHAVAEEGTPEHILAGQELAARIACALRQLPSRTRDVYFLRAMRRLKFNDIALRLDISSRAAKEHMAKALRHLAQALNEHNGQHAVDTDGDERD